MAIFLKQAQSPKLLVITHSKCFLVSNLNLSGCNQSTVCLLGIGKHLDRKVILPFLSARTHISQWNKYVCQGSGPSWQSPGAQEGTVANIDMGPPLGVGAGVLGVPRGYEPWTCLLSTVPAPHSQNGHTHCPLRAQRQALDPPPL